MRGAIVTGAASGIGAVTAEALVRAGYSVVLFDIVNPKQTLETLLAIRPRSALALQGDVRKLEDIRAAIKMITDHFAPFRVLVNNAGIGSNGQYNLHLTPSCSGTARISLFIGTDANDLVRANYRQSVSEAQRIIDINFTSVVHFTSEACQAMRSSGQGGVIVNLASAAGTIPISYQPLYAATKAAVIHLTRSMEPLRNSDNIRVCALAPTFIDTPMVRAIEPELRETLVKSTGGLLQVDEVVHVIMRFITEEEHAGAVLKMVPGKIFPWPSRRTSRL